MLDGVSDTELQPPYAVDGLLTTRYATGQAQTGTEWFEVDLGQAVAVDGLELNDTNDPMDVANAYTVEVSTDAATWTTVAMSATPAPPDLVLSFAAVTARYVRFDQTGMSTTSWWSIDELTINCAP
jgi:endo-1,3(4)-beta-glucanase